MGVSYDLNALSGINAASTGLGVISNNLANAQSVGFKSSRAEFADMFSGAQNSAGNGVRVEAVTQDFTQGTLAGTGRELDMAVDGEGFFILEDKSGKYDAVYTRNGSFKLDKDGFLTDQSGNKVQGFLLNETLSTEKVPVFNTTLSSIDLDDLSKAPRPTSEMNFDINVDGAALNNVSPNTGVSVGTTASLDQLVTPSASAPYDGFPDFSTNKIVYDSLGGEHRLTTNFYKRDVIEAANSDVLNDGTAPVAPATGDKYTSWIAQATMQDYDSETGNWVTSGHLLNDVVPRDAEGMIYELRYNTNGTLIDVREPADPLNPIGQSVLNTPLPAANWTSVGTTPAMQWIVDTPLTGATDPLGVDAGSGTISIQANFSDMTQYSGDSVVRGVTQDGYKIGDLVGISTGLDGVVQARYSNGRSVSIAQVALANFADKNAMEKLGGQTYAETYSSGTRQLGAPQSVGMGTINAGSLEYSNVDVAGELVNMIQTQRTYQASAQVISTSQTLTQTILNL